MYETQTKVLCFYSTCLLTAKVLPAVYFKDNNFFQSFSFLLQGHGLNQETMLDRRVVVVN